jgi:preprotein translocase subunit SecG
MILINIVHVLTCVFLILVVLLQQGKGGGMGSAFGGGAATQVFGGSGAGNLLTRATSVCAGLFMVTSLTLAWFSSSGDRVLRKIEEQQTSKKKSQDKPRDAKAASSSAPATSSTVK